MVQPDRRWRPRRRQGLRRDRCRHRLRLEVARAHGGSRRRWRSCRGRRRIIPGRLIVRCGSRARKSRRRRRPGRRGRDRRTRAGRAWRRTAADYGRAARPAGHYRHRATKAQQASDRTAVGTARFVAADRRAARRAGVAANRRRPTAPPTNRRRFTFARVEVTGKSPDHDQGENNPRCPDSTHAQPPYEDRRRFQAVLCRTAKHAPRTSPAKQGLLNGTRTARVHDRADTRSAHYSRQSSTNLNGRTG